jgi:hypothetical protein
MENLLAERSLKHIEQAKSLRRRLAAAVWLLYIGHRCMLATVQS